VTARPKLTQARVRELLHYNPETGEFHWLPRPGNAPFNSRSGGKLAGHEQKGYWRIRFDSRNHAAHRLAWLYMKGWLPQGDVDHRDGNWLNNRIENLRACTSKSQNRANQRMPQRQGKSHPVGCCWLASRRKWQVYIGAGGKRIFVGLFDSRDAAERAYRDAAEALHGDFSVTARPVEPELRRAA
jgi:HNH endonuclease